MIGDLFNNNKRREVCTREGQIIYKGKKYAKEKETGYYVCTSGSRRRLHVVMWESEHGRSVPAGCIIHHIDWDKNNNTIGNLALVTVEEHNLIHNRPKKGELGERQKKIIMNLIDRGLIK